MSTWLTVPTRFDRPSLWRLLKDCGIPRERVVIVSNEMLPASMDWGANIPPKLIQDFERPNIQRWWNRGLTYAAERGGDVCIVINDDVKTHASLEPLAQTVRDADATIGAPIHGLCGWLFALNLKHDVRPNEEYQWWYGDNDLFIRAHTQGRGVVIHNLPVKHLNPDTSRLTQWQAELVKQDQKLFAEQWGALSQ